MPRLFMSSALIALAACAARPSDWATLESAYRFTPGEVLRFRVESHLSVDMNGTHLDFLPNGMTKPFEWNLDGEFDNEVLDVDESGDAQIERRVKNLESSGHHLDEKFGLSWNREGGGSIPEEASFGSAMDRFAANMISLPMKLRVNGQGTSRSEEPAHQRLVMRRGLMYWPLGLGVDRWSSTEEIALPILHDKIRLTFANSIIGRRGDVVHITAPASLSDATRKVLAVAGGASAEFDPSSGRLKRLVVHFRIRCSGKAPVAAGSDGAIKCEVTYKEIQVLIE